VMHRRIVFARIRASCSARKCSGESGDAAAPASACLGWAGAGTANGMDAVAVVTIVLSVGGATRLTSRDPAG
jgi:hypothetical protein